MPDGGQRTKRGNGKLVLPYVGQEVQEEEVVELEGAGALVGRDM
jgi:hypothetical protein